MYGVDLEHSKWPIGKLSDWKGICKQIHNSQQQFRAQWNFSVPCCREKDWGFQGFPQMEGSFPESEYGKELGIYR